MLESRLADVPPEETCAVSGAELSPLVRGGKLVFVYALRQRSCVTPFRQPGTAASSGPAQDFTNRRNSVVSALRGSVACHGRARHRGACGLPLNGGMLPLGIAARDRGQRRARPGLYSARISRLGFAMIQFLRTGLLLSLSLLAFAAAAIEEPAASDLGRKQTVGKEGEEVVHYCTEMEDVQFVGSGNRITVYGPCNSIGIQGSTNQLDLQGQATQIAINGDDNKVSWPPADRQKPTTNLVGKRNIVEQAKTD